MIKRTKLKKHKYATYFVVFFALKIHFITNYFVYKFNQVKKIFQKFQIRNALYYSKFLLSSLKKEPKNIRSNA